MKRTIVLALALLPAAMTIQSQQPKPFDCSASSSFLPGGTFSLTADSATTGLPASFQLTLAPTVATEKKLQVSWFAKDEKDLSFPIPPNATDGIYDIQQFKKTIPATPKTASTSATETVTSDIATFSPTQIVVQTTAITAVSPAAAFADDSRSNQLVLIGQGFCPSDKTTPNDHVQFRFTGLPTPVLCGTILHGAAVNEGCYKLNVDNDRQITLSFQKLKQASDYFKGKQGFAIAVDGVWTAPATLTLIDTTQSTPLTVAVAGFLLIVVIIYLLLRSGEHATKQTMNGKTYWLSVLFYDVQTNSYSLSKCQFYAWTAAAVIGYLFLAVSKSFVQGSAIFPDIPPGLPGILIASVGTVVLSNGITSAKGDKGAGAQGPNLSDFIASGGMVAPDRLQFAIWTVVGIGTFLAIVFQSDPRNINDLPAIPSGFLQLMGISSGGYLAGKLARKAGPTIAAIVVKTENSMFKFQLTGSGLSRSATFSIDDQPIFPDSILRKDGQPGLPEVVQQDPSITDPDYARILTFYLKNFPDFWLGGPRNFTITNPDSQKATMSYQKFKVASGSIEIAAAPPSPALTAPVPAPTAPTPAPATPTPTPTTPAPAPTTPAPAPTTPAPAAATFKMTGECLDSNLTVTCAVAGSTADPVEVKRTDPTTKDATGKEVPPPATSYNGTVTGLTKGDVVTVSITDEAGFTRKIEPVTVA
ncbi:MAG TPA: hypothetical protein VGE83_12010 [Terracidiphilus sp.]|jgi:hypothetical protein